MSKNPVAAALGSLANAGAIAALGPLGLVAAPVIDAACHWAGEALGHEHGPLKPILESLGHLTGDATREFVSSNREHAKHDLEAVIAAALEHALHSAQRNLRTPGILAEDFDDWFSLWLDRLKRARNTVEATATLFYSNERLDPVALAHAESSQWWPAFRPVLLRWAASQRRLANPSANNTSIAAREEVMQTPSCLPDPLERYLAQNLLELTREGLHAALRDEKHKRGFIAWQQQFLEDISSKLRATNADLAQSFQLLAHRLDDLSRYLNDEFAGLHSHLSGVETRIVTKIDSRYRLPLSPLRPPQPLTADRELDILLAENRAIPVVGRGPDLANLHAWLASAAPISVHILTGPAGSGKTRLAVQLLEELSPHWHAGILRELDPARLNQCDWDQPTLAIVDYAASAPQPLKSWLDHLAGGSRALPLRILLLEREAGLDSGWLGTLLDRTSTGHRIESLLDPSAPQRVTPLAGLDLRRQILAATLQKLGAVPALPAPGEDPLFDQRLAGPLWQDPLCLMMAALVAHQPGALLEALSLAKADLAFHLAARELDRIRKFLPAGGQPAAADLLAHLAGIATACRTLEPGDLITIAKEENSAMGLEFPGGPRAAAKLAGEALNRNGKPAPIEPDIVGEAVLLKCFGGDNLTEGAPALVRAARRFNRRHAASVCSSITRTCQDYATDSCRDSLAWVEELIRTGESGDLDLLLELENQMPHDTLVLRETSVRIGRLLLARFTELQRGTPSDENQLTVARLTNNLAFRLSELGCREEALTQAEEAVRIYRQLAQQRPEAFLPALGMSLNNLATMLSGLGRREEALAQAEEAVRIYRQLAQQRPDAFMPDLAGSLNNLANMLSDLGRREEALAQAQEAVRIRRQLAQQRPDAFMPDLAMSLNNLAKMLSDLGRREEALAQAEEAVRIYRQLAQQRPDAFLPGLAMSVNNLAKMLSDLGRREEALAQAEEAVGIRRQLAQQRPDAFLPGLAMSVNNLATMLSDLARREEALAQVEEAVRIRRQLAQQRPDAFMPDLAMSLNNLAKMLSDLGRREEALAQAEEAVRIYRQLAQQRPDAFMPDLAGSLNNLANMLSDLGRREEALAQAQEAVRIRRQLAQQRPDVFLPDLAMSLNNLAKMLSDLGRREEALAQAEEAVRIYRQLAQQRPDAFLPDLAMSVNNLATMLSDLARCGEALEPAEEAVRIRRQLAQQRPDAFLPDLARSLAVRGTIIAQDRPGEATPCFEEAIRLLTPLFLRLPQAHIALIQRICSSYVQTTALAGKDPDPELLAPIAGVLERIGATQRDISAV